MMRRLPARGGGFLANLVGGCWLLGHAWELRDGHGHLRCIHCGKVT